MTGDPSDNRPLVQLSDLSFSYEKEAILRNISLEIQTKEFVGIIGPNGSGKSTLLKLMGGIMKNNQCLFKGKSLDSYARKDLARFISWLSQENVLPFSFRVLDVVLMGRYPYLTPLTFEGEEDYRIAQRALELTNSSGFADRFYNEISGGEKQRVMIAAALTQESELMLLDEPTSSLDIRYQIEILNILRRLNSNENMTLVLALHDLHLASRYCSRLILLNKGKIVKDGSPDQVLQKEILEEVYGVEIKIHHDTDDGSFMILPK
ncbi:MAG: ABC transporter ATP-binding protein [Nitrospinota bacterium]|nr:ABC transporter ATP-binding protein [Nitrospinota bacterium]